MKKLDIHNLKITEVQFKNLLMNIAGSCLLAFAVCAFIAPFDPTAFVTTEFVKDVRGRGYTMERIWIDLD